MKPSGKHGPTSQTWRSMLSRCNPEKAEQNPNYSGRGISVCERWQSYDNFLADMGERPDGLSIDRIDNNGNYEPDNCRWATRTEQARNTRANVLYEYMGRHMCIAEIAEAAGIQRAVLQGRLDSGWPLQRAISEPVGESGIHSLPEPYTNLEVCMRRFQDMRSQLERQGLTADEIANRVPRRTSQRSAA